METAGGSYICNCPGYKGCQYQRFADLSCSSCSPYGCGYFSPNGTMYGPIGTDPRPASCACTNCDGDLSNAGLGDFRIAFTVSTTATAQTPLINQRPSCANGQMWDVRMGTRGEIGVEVDDGAGHYTVLYSSAVAVNDGLHHAVVVRRTSGTITITVDGVLVGTGASSANLGALTALLIGADPCVGVDGTTAFAGSLTDVCVSR
jgi:hypothetical protein